MQLADTLAKIDPQVLVIQHAELLATAIEQRKAIGMKGSGLNLALGPQFFLDALAHLAGSVVSVSKRENFVSAGVALTNQTGDSAGKDGGLASSGSGHHQHGTVKVLNRLLLVFVGGECGGSRCALGRLHWDEDSRDG